MEERRLRGNRDLTGSPRSFWQVRTYSRVVIYTRVNFRFFFPRCGVGFEWPLESLSGGVSFRLSVSYNIRF